jgi:hypothetical protein
VGVQAALAGGASQAPPPVSTRRKLQR